MTAQTHGAHTCSAQSADDVAAEPAGNLRQELRQAFENWNTEALFSLTTKLTESLAREQNCCMNDESRGHACQYHQGVEAGMDYVLDMLSFMQHNDGQES